MVIHRDLNHPRKIYYDEMNMKPKFLDVPVCGANVGWATCNKSVRDSDFREYGVGIV